MRRVSHILVFLALTITAGAQEKNQARPAEWAQPVSSHNLSNLYKLDEKFYRSEQPHEEAFGELKTLGIKSVLNLREYHPDEKDAETSGIKCYWIKIRTSNITDEEVIAVLKILQEAPKPILVHCKHGADRTGLVSAFYRIIYQGWTKEDAIDELLNGGYGFHTMYDNIPEYIRNADIEKLRQASLE